MEKILVGFDGSENARVALMFAIREAQVRDAALKLLCAWELPSEGWGEFPPPGSALVH